ncbi:transposase [Nocardia sp. NBC_01730]|uniref:Tn3 family transposase n=1 Tax=Nocardia sp. NBC_01730 TaxID=2975998 RepID=UPI002E128654|nr:transposase [Nocardia sp. NBC_01730]
MIFDLPLGAIARHRVNLERIRAHWPDMPRVAGALLANRVRSYDLIRMLARNTHPPPGQAFAECGHIAETLHLLAMVDPIDTATGAPYTAGSPSRSPATAQTARIFHGQRGEQHHSYPEGQEDALGLVSTPWCCGTPAT